MSRELEAAAAARQALEARRAEAAPAGEPAVGDPLRYCVWATLALLAWLVSPGALMVWFGALGCWRYLQAHRAGLRRTQCWLRTTRWAMVYLALVAAAGAALCVLRFLPRHP